MLYGLIGLIVILAGYLFLIRTAPMKEEYDFIRGINFAHRGYHTKDKEAPENSLAAFRLAVRHGYGIEFDVQMTKDGKVVVFHDDTLERLCGVARLLREMTYEEIQRYPLQESDYQIPLLSDVLKEVNGKAVLYIEIKYYGRDCAPLCQALIDALASYSGKYAFASFNPYALHYMKKHASEIMRIQIVQDYQDSSLPKWQKFALEHLFLNFYSSPHGISYEYNQTNWTFHVCKFMMAYSLGWTIKSKEELDHYRHLFDGVVFEQVEAPRRMS